MKSIKGRTISVVGLGYVGLPLALAFSKKFKTVGFDTNERRVKELRNGHDKNGEMTGDELRQSSLTFTNELARLKQANFHVVAVPTPVDGAHQPDMTALRGATETVGRVLKRGDIVVYESTVYPGVTEEICVPILEDVSGLRGLKDFKVGYSPERINPGDKEHTFTKIKKVVSGQDKQTLEIIAAVYGSVVEAGVYKAESIKVAEAAKVIENTQRDLNIALINELAIIFDRMGIDTGSVLRAAGTKWNFLHFTPGLVGGHCIGVDPYYLTHKAETLGYIPQVILAGRRINDGMGKFIAQKTIKEMIRGGCQIRGSVVTVLGLTFKENCSDLRNTKVVDIIRDLEEYGLEVQVYDPIADPEEAKKEYGLVLQPISRLKRAAAIIFAVSHDTIREMTISDIKTLARKNAVLIDVKGIVDSKAVKEGFALWRL